MEVGVCSSSFDCGEVVGQGGRGNGEQADTTAIQYWNFGGKILPFFFLKLFTTLPKNGTKKVQSSIQLIFTKMLQQFCRN